MPLAVIVLILLLSCCSEARHKVSTVYNSKENNVLEQSWQINKTVDHLESTRFVKEHIKLFNLSESKTKSLKKINYNPNIWKNGNDLITNQKSCPTWMYRINSTSDCQCGKDLRLKVKCNKTLSVVSVLNCNCMTYDRKQRTLVVGKCFYGCTLGSLYKQLPLNVSDVNNMMCGKLNRDGRLCAKCKKGFSPLLYSFDFHCINCSHSIYNWGKFVAVAFIPSTFCFFLVVICKINALSPQLHGFVQISQAFGAAINLRIILYVSKGYYLEIAKLIALPYGVVNLDFFRSYINDICVNLTTLQVLALDYTTAIYPLLLIIFLYILIELHARNCRLILVIWKPFRAVVESRNWDIQSSIIQAFATFLLLSYGKLLSVTFDLLVPTRLYNVTGDFLGLYVYYDTSYKYFSQDHLPYASLALIITLIFLIPPPLLLLIYPMSCFQKCFNHRSPRLHTFVECYHGYYKDGTDPGTRDCRWVAAMYFIVNIVFVFIFYGLTRNVLCYTFIAISVTVFGIIIVIVKPYKAPYSMYDNVDSAILFLIAMWCASVAGLNEAQLRAQNLVPLASIMSVIIALMPLAYILSIIINWLYKIHLKKWCKKYKLCVNNEQVLNDSQPIEGFECEREVLLS